MCCFAGQKGTRVDIRWSTLQLPLPEELPPDVIIGWRRWSVSSNGYLTSPFRSTRWPADVLLRAAYLRGGHNGIYADRYAPEFAVYGGAWGQVALCGQVWKYDNGYVAEYAYPVALWVKRYGAAIALHRKYGKYGVWINVPEYNKANDSDVKGDKYNYIPYEDSVSKPETVAWWHGE